MPIIIQRHFKREILKNSDERLGRKMLEPISQNQNVDVLVVDLHDLSYIHIRFTSEHILQVILANAHSDGLNG